jgi:hypothetical protein
VSSREDVNKVLAKNGAAYKEEKENFVLAQKVSCIVLQRAHQIINQLLLMFDHENEEMSCCTSGRKKL